MGVADKQACVVSCATQGAPQRPTPQPQPVARSQPRCAALRVLRCPPVARPLTPRACSFADRRDRDRDRRHKGDDNERKRGRDEAEAGHAEKRARAPEPPLALAAQLAAPQDDDGLEAGELVA
jgi:hypothetical protein